MVKVKRKRKVYEEWQRRENCKNVSRSFFLTSIALLTLLVVYSVTHITNHPLAFLLTYLYSFFSSLFIFHFTVTRCQRQRQRRRWRWRKKQQHPHKLSSEQKKIYITRAGIQKLCQTLTFFFFRLLLSCGTLFLPLQHSINPYPYPYHGTIVSWYYASEFVSATILKFEFYKRSAIYAMRRVDVINIWLGTYTY